MDLARYWFALDAGLAEPPPFDTNILAAYFYQRKVPTCPAGGSFSVNRVSGKVECSLPKHMFDSCKSKRRPPAEAGEWQREYPVDYKNSEWWWYSLDERSEGLLIRLSGAEIIFTGVHDWGDGCGTVSVGGSGTGHSSSCSGTNCFTTDCGNGVCKLSLLGDVLTLTENGQKLDVNSQAFDLSTNRPTIVVETSNDIHVQAESKGEIKNTPL